MEPLVVYGGHTDLNLYLITVVVYYRSSIFSVFEDGLSEPVMAQK